MSAAAEVARKLQLKAGGSYWVWPDGAPLPAALLNAPGVTPGSVADAHVAILFAHSGAEVDEAFAAHISDLASIRAVWIIYPKGNAADINRNKLWMQLAKYRWRAVAQFSFDEKRSALRIRELKPGEESPVEAAA